MAYIRKDIKNLISLMDRKFIVDTPLRKWIKLNIYPKHNLIIKTKKEYRCTNCNKIFMIILLLVIKPLVLTVK